MASSSSPPRELPRRSTVDALAESLRARILDGELEPGTPLREETLAREYDVARHSLRSALRALSAEGIVQIEPNRGARVALLTAEDVRGLSELRTAIEVEAARMALAAGGGRLPALVHSAMRRLASACRRARPSWGAVAETHEALHHAIVEAAGSPRLAAVHRQAGAELRLFVLQLPPAWTFERIASDHERLVEALETDGADALRPHIAESTAALLEQAAG
ncbi:MAG TPA: GntR family transcriptional regulator [Thermoleophilaceae bacterium]|nr:GntR family transcriptional regulator [Thermoleophilaceae bacterium]